MPLVVAFATGILLHSILPRHPLLLLIFISLLSIAAAFTLHRHSLCSMLLAFALVACGAALAQHERYQYPRDQVGLFSGDEPRLVEAELALIDEPHMVTGAFAEMRALPPKQVAWSQLLRVKTWRGWTTASGALLLQVDQPHPRLDAGQTVRVFGMLHRPPPAMNPGQFDWASYYREQRVLAAITAPTAGNVEILTSTGPSLLTSLRLRVRRLLASGFTANRATEQALLGALLLGDREEPMRDVQEDFRQTGVAYHLSVSGLHVAMLGAIVFWVCRVARLRPRFSLLITAVFVALYTIVALPSHSGARSALLFLAIALASWSRRPIDRFQLLALAAFFMLLWRPLDLYSGGFQFSFLAVAALTIFLPRLREFFQTLRDPHLAAAGDLLVQPPLEAALARIIAGAIRSLQFAGIIWLATLPLVASRFGQINPWMLAAAVPLLPVAVTALLCGLMKIVLTLLWPSLAGAWAVGAALPILALEWVVDHMKKLPGGAVPLGAPPTWLFFVYYALLLLPLVRRLPLLRGRRRWIVRLAPGAGVIAIFVLPLVPRLQHPIDRGRELRVTLLSVGAGQCAVIEAPGAQPTLFDAGSSSVSDLTRRIIGPFLRSQGRRSVDKIVLSHGDYDHVCAAGEVATAYGASEVLISPHFRRHAEGNPIDETLLDMLDKRDLPPRVIRADQRMDLGGDVTVDVLWPVDVSDFNSNNTGLVLRMNYAGRTILFPADIQDPAMAALLKNPAKLKADVLIAPHHGSAESLTPAFLRAVDPSLIVSSNAWRLTNKQKRFDRMSRGRTLYRTDQCGAITIMVTRDGDISIDTFIKQDR